MQAGRTVKLPVRAFCEIRPHMTRYTVHTLQERSGWFQTERGAGHPPLLLQACMRYDSDFEGSVEVGAEHVGEFFADDANTARVASHPIFNASVGYSLLQ